MRNHCCTIRTSSPTDYQNRPNHGQYNKQWERKIWYKILDGTLDLNDLMTVQILCANVLSTYIVIQGGEEIVLLTLKQVDL